MPNYRPAPAQTPPMYRPATCPKSAVTTVRHAKTELPPSCRQAALQLTIVIIHSCQTFSQLPLTISWMPPSYPQVSQATAQLPSYRPAAPSCPRLLSGAPQPPPSFRLPAQLPPATALSPPSCPRITAKVRPQLPRNSAPHGNAKQSVSVRDIGGGAPNYPVPPATLSGKQHCRLRFDPPDGRE